MKFLIVVRHKDSLYSLSPKARLEVIKGATAFTDKYLKAGKCKDLYFDGDMKGTVSIWEFQSSEEIARVTFENPMLPFLDVKITPIIEHAVGTKVRMKALEKAAKK